MNTSLWIEENDAWFARADRFDGFDRGDRAGHDDDARDEENAAILAAMLAEEAAA